MTLWTWVALFSLLWLSCGVASAGFVFADTQRRPGISGQGFFSWAWIPLGGLGLFLLVAFGGTEYGWKWPARSARREPPLAMKSAKKLLAVDPTHGLGRRKVGFAHKTEARSADSRPPSAR